MLRWTCLEVDCAAVVDAPDEDTLIEAVNHHVGEAHQSFELDDVILAVAEQLPDDTPPAT
jgi:hypothetical protein